MAPVNLQKLVTRDKQVTALIETLCVALRISIGIQDASGATVAGRVAGDAAHRHPIHCDGEVVGWVVGDAGAAAVAAAIAYAATHDLEKRSLAREALDKYRELNLLYDLSEKIGASLQVQAIAGVAIGEARRLIRAASAAMLLINAPSGVMSLVAALGDQPIVVEDARVGEGIIGGVALSGRAEVVNDTLADARRSAADSWLRSLVCAPLKAKQHVIGVLVLGSAELAHYTAADLKFLSVIASQIAPAIDNALLYEKTVREARERELQLQRQLAELRIQVDQALQSRQ